MNVAAPPEKVRVSRSVSAVVTTPLLSTSHHSFTEVTSASSMVPSFCTTIVSMWNWFAASPRLRESSGTFCAPADWLLSGERLTPATVSVSLLAMVHAVPP